IRPRPGLRSRAGEVVDALGLPLDAPRLLESEERPAVVRIALEIRLVHALGLLVVTRGHEERTERVTNRLKPARRLVVEEAVLDLHRLSKKLERLVVVALTERELAVHHLPCEREHRVRGIETDRPIGRHGLR